MKTFQSILAFQKEFDTDQKCREYLELQLWNGQPVCPYCQSNKAYKLAKGVRYVCSNRECKKTFSVTVGTVFENTKIPLTKWFLAMYILSVHSKGISSLQLATWLDVTQRTAWFLNHRIRVMLTDKSFTQLTGTVEVDETYIGGVEGNKHANKRSEKKGLTGKTMVLGAVQRGGNVKLKVIPKTNIDNINQALSEFVQPNSTMVTDEHHAYNKVHLTYNHEKVHHKAKEYVRGNVHTNNIEGYWNILKKQIDGIHHSVSPKHLQRYCNESAYRYNNRTLAQDERFSYALNNCNGRLKYADLIAQ